LCTKREDEQAIFNTSLERLGLAGWTLTLHGLRRDTIIIGEE
jgi:hypothetical protein